MKIIETKRLILRKWCKDDYLDMYDYASDDRVGLMQDGLYINL